MLYIDNDFYLKYSEIKSIKSIFLILLENLEDLSIIVDIYGLSLHSTCSKCINMKFVHEYLTYIFFAF